MTCAFLLRRMTYKLITGAKSIPLNSLSEEAWQIIAGPDKETTDAKYYGAVSWLHRCVNIRMAAMQAMPWAIVRGETDIWTSDETAPPADLAWAADLPALLGVTEAALTLLGTAYWFVSQNRVRPLGMRWLTPSSVKPIWDSSNGLVGYKRRLNGQDIDLTLRDVVYFALQNPLHETEPGDSPAKAAMRAAGVLFNVDAFASSFFERGAIKATILSVPPASPKAEVEKLNSWWKRTFRGSDKAWEAAVTPVGVEPKVVGDGIAELGNSELTQDKREDIATALGIPHSLVFSDSANYATAQQDELNFLRYTIIPASRLIADAINKQLLSRFGLMLQFRPQELDAMQEDENQRSASLGALVSAGVPLLTAMDILGYDLTDEQRAAIEESERKKEEQADMMNQLALDEADSGQAKEDEDRWQRKALSALKAGKAAGVAFSSRHIDPVRQADIAHGLEHAASEQEVRAVFAAKPFWGGYP